MDQSPSSISNLFWLKIERFGMWSGDFVQMNVTNTVEEGSLKKKG